MTARIAIPCSEQRPERRHRWRWRNTHYEVAGGFVQDRWCQNCGRWYTDVIERKDG